MVCGGKKSRPDTWHLLARSSTLFNQANKVMSFAGSPRVPPFVSHPAVMAHAQGGATAQREQFCSVTCCSQNRKRLRNYQRFKIFTFSVIFEQLSQTHDFLTLNRGVLWQIGQYRRLMEVA